jgi:predicted GIY-YIG superfamily endonuclease
MWHVDLCNRQGQFYTGLTTDLSNRMRQHKAELLYLEPHPDKNGQVKRIGYFFIVRKSAVAKQAVFGRK